MIDPLLPIVRAARASDAGALLGLALNGGAGLTNLPAHRPTLEAKLARSEAAFTDTAARGAGAPLVLITEIHGRAVGTACVFARVGAEWPFYSYRLVRQAKASRAADRVIAQRLLMLANDFDGEAEVGGLFIDPAARGNRLGVLTARARYLLMAQHRDWFATRVIAELRGYQDAEGSSPVWEALGRHFYHMDFDEADRLNATQGNQFIADLGARYPIYVSLLPEVAQRALGRPHDDGRRAFNLCLAEGFRQDGYVDIFDGGPTVVADIDALRTVREAKLARLSRVDARGGTAMLLCAGHGLGFRATCGMAEGEGGALRLAPGLADALAIGPGDIVRFAPA